MIDFVVDNDESYKEYHELLETKQATLLSVTGNVAKISLNRTILNIELAPKYLAAKENTGVERLTYGKNTMSNIVNITIEGDLAHIFTEKDGVVSCEEIKYKHWVLSSKPTTREFKRLIGEQHFKYIKEYETAEDFERIQFNIYKMGLYHITNKAEAMMVRHGYTYFKNSKVEDVSVLSFDIETSGLNPMADDAKVFLITNAYRKGNKTIKRTFNVDDYASQYDMIQDWAKWFCEIDPSLVIGHNIVIFDFPYINTVMQKEGLTLSLGRKGRDIEFEERVKELRVDGNQSYSYHKINIFGREIVDTFFLAIKADIAKKYTSYALKQIVKQEGLEKEGRVHYDASKIKDNWHIPEEREKIIAYAEDDADDPIKLFDLMVAPFFYLTPHIPKPFQMMIESATGSQLNALMVRSYLQDGYSVAKATDIEPYEGAISFGNCGIYDNVFKVDVASLYPSIMRLYKIAPKGKDFNENFLKVLEYFTLERLKNKQLAKDTKERYYKDLEQAQKVVINSAYGFMGASGLNYNYGDGAAEVTRYGREIITKSVEWATGHTLKKVVVHIKNKGKDNEELEYEWMLGDKVEGGKGFTISNCDTDSISFTAHRELSEQDRKTLLDELNSLYDPLISFADDGYFKRVIILKAKNYILQTYDGKVKLKGNSLKDQKKEPALKEFLSKIIGILLENDT